MWASEAVRGRLGHYEPAHGTEQAFIREMARAPAAGLLPGRQHKGQAAAGPGRRDGGETRRHESRHPALHVRRAAAVEPAVAHFARGIARPGPRPERHDVEVAGEGERRETAMSPRKVREQAGLAGRKIVPRHGEAAHLQQRREMRRAGRLAARRAHGIEPDEVEGERDGIDHEGSRPCSAPDSRRTVPRLSEASAR